ncbi:MAG: sugar ABC transporter permease [Xylanivirga thermophila]|jgi:multiple sugar transport system permease protein|uniref:carbohydrate ABC transporter permease n=1 Tax=Xylanivirga thermophila TaxID=2496273 RepID=UPI00101E1B8E|nr:sugar ABC transporter permease [Xylanivirga thermophila]
MAKVKSSMSSTKKRYAIIGFLFASPWIIGFIIFQLYPIAISIYNSFTDFNIFQTAKWIGLKNYIELFRDEKYFKSLYNTMYMTLIGTPITLLAGLISAILLNTKVKGMSFFRTVFYIPNIVPAIASAMLWLWILDPQYGLINTILRQLSLPQPNWLVDPKLTKPSMILMSIWRTGGIMIIFLAALQDVPKSLYEAAEVDGASRWSRFIHITLPCISPIILYQLIMGVITNLQSFSEVYILSRANKTGLNEASGGPENSLLFYSLYLYQNAFYYFKMGKASAQAWIMFIIVALITWLIFNTSHKWVTYGGEE